MLHKSLNRVTVTAFLAALFPILTMAYGKGYNIVALAMLIVALFSFKQLKEVNYTPHVKHISGVFIIYYLTYVISIIIHQGDISRIDGPSRIVLALPIFYLLLRYPPKFSWIATGILIGSCIAGLSAMYQISFLGVERAFAGADFKHFLTKGHMPIQSGNIAMTLGAMSLAISIAYYKERQWLKLVFGLTAAALGVTASILSGSRGGWVILPVAVLYLTIANRHCINRKALCILFASFIFVPVGISKVPIVQAKIDETVSNIYQYGHGERYSSLGIRFELWKSAVNTFKNYPILGAGEEQRLVLRKQLGDDGVIDPKVAEYSGHSHNQYLEDLSLRGIFGLSALLMLLAYPLVLFSRFHSQSVSNLAKTINQCGVVSIILMSGYFLSQAMFKHTSGTIFFAIMTAILLSSAISINQRDNNANPDL